MILQPGRNAWRIERAERAAVLIDAGAYFQAVRSALLKARHRVFIVGWDIHSRTRLVGESGTADDGYPDELGAFLTALVKERPKLKVTVLVWDFAVLYATERELFPTYSLGWATPRNIRFGLDNAVPIGSSQHQKIIVVDDAIAFSGGLDVTVRRWDSSAHDLDNPYRVDPAGKPYSPFHDVQAIVDGAAARALAQLVRERWRCLSRERIPLVKASHDPWPDGVTPEFTGVDVGISRTQPEYEDQVEVREVEALFIEMIASAQDHIYIENQFLSCAAVAEALAKRLRERPRLEVLLVAPSTHHSWLEARSMRNGRIRFMKILEAADAGDRVRLFYPQVGGTVGTMVHSKVTVIDDKILRVGSANLNNRSMGTDTECDLTIVAKNDAERRAIVNVRHRLIADHCGCAQEDVAAAFKKTGSLIAVAETLERNGHRLVQVDDGEPDANDFSKYIEGVADPERPIGAEEFVSNIFGGLVPRRQAPTVIKIMAAAIVVLILALVWSYSPLSTLAQPQVVGEALESFAQGPWAPLVVFVIFIGGGFVLFPVTILVAATAATFGPWLGFTYALAGALGSALLTYALGARLGKETLSDMLGPRLNRIRRSITRKGILAVATIRLVPLAPFTVVNLVAGASGISLSQYFLGTVIGLLPGLIVMSALGDQLSEIFANPSPRAFVTLALVVAAWIAVSIGLQALVTKYGSNRH